MSRTSKKPVQNLGVVLKTRGGSGKKYSVEINFFTMGWEMKGVILTFFWQAVAVWSLS